MGEPSLNQEISDSVKRLTPSVLKEGFWRVLSFLVSSTFFSLLPIVLFIVHMNQYEYFSYDFFNNGLFGLKSFFALMVFSILILAVFFFSLLMPLAERYIQKRKPKFIEYAAHIILAIASWSMLVLFIVTGEGNNFKDLFYLLAISLLVMAHITMLLYAKPKAQFASLVLVTFLFTIITSWCTQSVARGVNSALTSFGIGGFQCVTVSDSNSSYKIDGRLILASPDYIYLRKVGDKSAVTYIRVDSNTIYSVGEQYCPPNGNPAKVTDEVTEKHNDKKESPSSS